MELCGKEAEDASGFRYTVNTHKKDTFIVVAVFCPWLFSFFFFFSPTIKNLQTHSMEVKPASPFPGRHFGRPSARRAIATVTRAAD